MSPTGRLRSMPVNQTDETRVLARVDGELLNATVSASLSGVPFEDARPIRAFFAWPGKRNYEGLWWSSTTRSHVEFESLLEREFLLSADFDPEVVGVAAQPLSFLWPKGVTGQRWHVPDYFLRLADGSGRVVDVKRPDRVQRSTAQFDLTRAACREAGWDYQVFTGLPEPRRSNLAWLGGFRHDRHSPSPETLEVLLEVFEVPHTLGDGSELTVERSGLDESVVTANILHCLFVGDLRTDLNTILGRSSSISIGAHEREIAAESEPMGGER